MDSLPFKNEVRRLTISLRAANWKDMGNIYLQTCSDTEVAQKWVVMTDGRIALQESKPRKSSIV